MSATMEVQVPESQRLIAVSLGKIAMSRGQKGGINLHKNLLVATVLHKARTAYMIQQFARQRASQSPSPPPSTTAAATSSPPPPSNVEMREQQPSGEVSEPSSNTTTTYSSSSSSQSSLSSSSSVTAAPTFSPAAPSSSSPAAPPVAGVAAPSAESGSLPLFDGADVSSVQVAECEDKENTPPPSLTSSPIGDATQCEKRLQGENKNTIKDSEKNTVLPLSKPRHGTSVTQKSARGDYVSKGCCLLKRRRVMSSDHENVSAPKVRIVDTRLSPKQQDSTPEPMQCDSPQISNLVNIFSSSFAGLSGAGGEPSVRSVTVVGLSVSTTHKLSDNTCAQEMMVGLDSVRQSLVLSV
ncbi:immediate early response gene 5 protein-like [Littorina saxatilis]|uniref:Uncharacterized protein n=1 Tax=Littorina saxatilis TaxID=31220 RepID=A0AAN9AXX9_9CAEN